MPETPFALHISWTCYGNWLPGDRRGHVSNRHLNPGLERKHNRYGDPYSEGDAFTHARALALQQWPTVKFTAQQARCVAEALIECARKRNWHILQAAIMANHCHVVIAGCGEDGPAVRRILKGNTYAALSKLAAKRMRWWTAGGSDRRKYDDLAIDNAVNYVARQEFMLAGIKDMKLFIP